VFRHPDISDAEYNLIPVEDSKAWTEAISQCGCYDIYHLPEYHVLAQFQKEGVPFLFFMKNTKGCAALPFLLRQVSEIDGMKDCQYRDATSVYGYAGIVCSVKQDDEGSSEFREKFQKGFLKILREYGIIAFFSRLNPLIPTSWMFESMGAIISLCETVAIDLLQPESMQKGGMSKGHRYDVRKARSEGVTVREDVNFDCLDNFITMYNETMDHAMASSYYYFSKEYFLKCKDLIRDSIKLFIAEKNGAVISAAMFFLSNGIIQYHLSGTPRRYLNHGGAKAIIDEVRIWGVNNGYSFLHLGGGVGSKEDSLFQFKAGFSKVRFPFEVVNIIVNPQIYSELTEKRDKWVVSNGYESTPGCYFPKYRTPIIKYPTIKK
jgi:hypothetical protein